MVALGRRSRGPPPRRPVRSSMGPVSGRPAGRPRRGRVASCTNFLAQAASGAALRVQVGSRNMTSVSSSNSTEVGYGVSALKPAEPTGATEHPLALLYLGQAARQLRPAVRPLRTASAVAGQ